MSALDPLLVVILSFLLGSMPLARLASLNAIQRWGAEKSTASFIKVLTDILKGFLVVIVAQWFLIENGIVATAGVILGHVFPVLKNVRGGNGLGVTLGALVALEPTLGLTALSAWTFGYYVFQQAGTAALTSATAVLMISFSLPLPFSPLCLIPVAVFTFWRHRDRLSLGPQETT